MGIKASEREKVFQRLYRIDESRSQQVPGTGLGLSIVESYVQRLNGIVEISDNQPQGTIFTVRIPKPIEEWHQEITITIKDYTPDSDRDFICFLKKRLIVLKMSQRRIIMKYIIILEIGYNQEDIKKF